MCFWSQEGCSELRNPDGDRQSRKGRTQKLNGSSWGFRRAHNSKKISEQQDCMLGSLVGRKTYMRMILVCVLSVTASRGTQASELECRDRNIASVRLKKQLF